MEINSGNLKGNPASELLEHNIDPELSEVSSFPPTCFSSKHIQSNDKKPVFDYSDGSVAASNMSSSDFILDDDFTDVDVDPSEDQKQNENVKRKTNPLMTLLSGSQKSKRKHHPNKAESKSLDLAPSRHSQSEFDISSTDSIPEDSFSEGTQNIFQREHEILELEKKFHNNNVKSVSAKDFLTFQNKKKKTEPVDHLLTEDDQIQEIDYKVIEEKMHSVNSNRRVVTAKDLFKSFGPVKGKNGKPSLLVTLKVNSKSLEEIHKYDSPFKTRGNDTSPSNKEPKTLLNTLRQPRKTRKVTIKINPTTLKEINKSANPLHTKSSGNSKGVNANSFFKSMIENATSSKKLTPLQKAKEVAPPTIMRDDFHVYCDDGLHQSSIFLSKFLRRNLNKNPNPDDKFTFPTNHKDIEESRILRSSTKFETHQKLLDFLIPKVPELGRTAIARIFNGFIKNDTKLASEAGLNWPEYFQPKSTQDLLVSNHHKHFIKTWVYNSFQRLKNQSTKTPRNVLIKQKKQQRLLQQINTLDNFVVDDENESTESDSDIFVPVLIIQGSIGSGKSSSVYAAVNEIDGYVHEVNAGQSRGRKDIFNNLRELCTTQLVHSHQTNKEEKEFQKGIVLFEDCDLLFEQDKGFWSVIQDLINISKRPIVITCNDIENIPKNIVEFAIEEEAIVNLDYRDPEFDQLIKDYIKICCLSQGFEFDNSLIEEIIKNSSTTRHHDIRKILMNCQLLCEPTVKLDHEIIQIKQERIKNSSTINDDLKSLSNDLEMMSVSDVITENSKSMIQHEVQPNDLVDIYFIDESTFLKQPTLPYEFNSGKHLNPNIDTFDGFNKPLFTFNELREPVNEFIGSRSKKLTKFLMELQTSRSFTRSHNMNGEVEYNPGTMGIPETSICNHLNRTAYMLELAPYTRIWKSYQNLLDEVETKSIMNNGVSVKKFLQWRQFQDESNEVLKFMIKKYDIEL